MSKTTISIDKNTREELKLLGKKDEDYDKIVKKCINFTKRFENEHQFHEWFKRNFSLFGFDKIKEERLGGSGSPDYIMIKGGREVRVELETLSSHFILHKHNPKEVDLVVCLVKDKELPVKTVEITPFEYITKTTIQVSDELRHTLKLLAVFKNTTYEKVLKELVEREMSKLDLDEFLKNNKRNNKKGNKKKKR